MDFISHASPSVSLFTPIFYLLFVQSSLAMSSIPPQMRQSHLHKERSAQHTDVRTSAMSMIGDSPPLRPRQIAQRARRARERANRAAQVNRREQSSPGFGKLHKKRGHKTMVINCSRGHPLSSPPRGNFDFIVLCECTSSGTSSNRTAGPSGAREGKPPIQ
ncbi:hypothetical protein EDB83DRAFT_933037 [Lactarius deliciosus]|nr:hypothetical protein EDB83DRAFT_933037 [Lactarius deliciosus]